MLIIKPGSIDLRNKIDAVKRMRKATRFGLREAKNIIDQLEDDGIVEVKKNHLPKGGFSALLREGFYITNLVPDELFKM